MDLKPALSLTQQVDTIAAKGFTIEDRQKASDFLARVGYYRVRAYFLPFRCAHGYSPKVSFTRIMRLYDFDSQLRMWLYRVIGDIEVYARTQIATHLALTYGSECYMECATFDSRRHRHDRYMERITSLIKANQNTPIVKHHQTTYSGHFPIWVIVEFFSTGMLSFTYADLKRSDRKQIAKKSFHTGDQQLESWLRAFTDLRNKCAHYTRFYLWRFTTIPRSFKGASWQMDATLFSQIYMLAQMHPDHGKWVEVVSELKCLIRKYEPDICLSHLGFPENWENLLLENACR